MGVAASIMERSFLLYLLFLAVAGTTCEEINILTPVKIEGYVAPDVLSFGENADLTFTVSEFPFKTIDLHDCIYFQFHESTAGVIHTTGCLTCVPRLAQRLHRCWKS